MERSLFLAFDPGGALAGSVATLLSLPPAAVDEWLDEWGRPPATSTLLGLGPDTGAVSREIARLPIFLAAAEHEVPISLGWELADYTVSVEIHTTAGPLTHVSLFILTVVHSEFIRAGSPSDGELPVTLAGVCRLLGRSAHGGWQIDDARRELRRLAGAEIVLRVRVRGQRPREERLRFFGYREEPGATNEVVLTLDPTIARHLRVGRSTYLDLSVYSALLSADPVASRIWAYWETLPWRPPGRRSFPLWPAPPGEAPPQMTWNLPLAAVAGLPGANRSWVRARIGRALLSVVALDPAYRDALIGPLSRGMATASLVRVARVRRPEPGEAGLVAAAPGVWSHRSITRGAIARGVWSHRAGGVEPSIRTVRQRRFLLDSLLGRPTRYISGRILRLLVLCSTGHSSSTRDGPILPVSRAPGVTRSPTPNARGSGRSSTGMPSGMTHSPGRGGPRSSWMRPSRAGRIRSRRSLRKTARGRHPGARRPRETRRERGTGGHGPAKASSRSPRSSARGGCPGTARERT